MGRTLITGTLADSNAALPTILLALLVIAVVIYLLAMLAGRGFRRGRR
jgi:CHASE3 domain sensor protein